jgi:hypothetical protein
MGSRQATCVQLLAWVATSVSRTLCFVQSVAVYQESDMNYTVPPWSASADTVV